MKKFGSCGLLLAVPLLFGFPGLAVAQHARMGMPANTLFLAQLNAEQVASGSTSSATGTGVFLLDPVQHTLEYHLTYQGLEAGGALRSSRAESHDDARVL